MKPKSENNNYDFILKVAVKLAEKVGREKINFDLIATEIGMNRSIIYFHFKTTVELKEAVLLYAIEHEVIILLIEALIFQKITKDILSESASNKIATFFEEIKK